MFTIQGEMESCFCTLLCCTVVTWGGEQLETEIGAGSLLLLLLCPSLLCTRAVAAARVTAAGIC